jgi:hypothetical protein
MLNIKREHIELSAKLYRCHDTVKRHFGNEFAEKIKPFMQLISGYAKEHGCDEMKAVLKLCDDDVIKNHGWTVICLMAAAVELIEPTDINL